MFFYYSTGSSLIVLLDLLTFFVKQLIALPNSFIFYYMFYFTNSVPLRNSFNSFSYYFNLSS